MASLGPSPRRWGNPGIPKCRECQSRAIPTQVGKSATQAIPLSVTSGHPHAGGEIDLCTNLFGAKAGPSPRRWGNQLKLSKQSAPLRAIPTQVGKSYACLRSSVLRPGHPHAGGEINNNITGLRWYIGPSPRRWGNHASKGREHSPSRAIPTQVGKSHRRISSAFVVAGHPHAGGEICF